MRKRIIMNADTRRSLAVLLAFVGFWGPAAQAGVVEFTDKDEWFAAVGDVTTIDFTGFEKGTLITDQFEELGVVFNGLGHFIVQSRGFEDGWGLHRVGDPSNPIDLFFTRPQLWIAVDFPGFVQFELFNDGKLLFTSSLFGGGGHGFFAGLVSTELFDAVLITDPTGDVFIDNLHFGVPAPGTLALLGLAAALPSRRRRR
jgi:hypothetical protein